VTIGDEDDEEERREERGREVEVKVFELARLLCGTRKEGAVRVNSGRAVYARGRAPAAGDRPGSCVGGLWLLPRLLPSTRSASWG